MDTHNARALFNNIVVVLDHPQDNVNIGNVVRAMKNMGLHRLRLVAPAAFDPYNIAGIAHRADDLIQAIDITQTLDEALADAAYIVGTSSQPRVAPALVGQPRAIAPELLRRAQDSVVVVLFGAEPNGLSNAAMDRCQRMITIPSDPDYPSLNLAQAVLLVAYELRMAVGDALPLPPAYFHDSPPADAATLERLIGLIQNSLSITHFLKRGREASMMRVIRSLVFRAQPSEREVGLLHALCMHFSLLARPSAAGRAQRKDDTMM